MFEFEELELDLTSFEEFNFVLEDIDFIFEEFNFIFEEIDLLSFEEIFEDK